MTTDVLAGKRSARFGFARRWGDFAKSIARSRLALFGLILFAIIVALAVTAPLIVPHDPLEQDLGETLMPPFWESGGSTKYLLGSDYLGRDILSRLLYGASVSLRVAGFATLFSLAIGVSIGLATGYTGGWFGASLMRVVDVFLAFPLILLALALAAILGPSITNLIIVMALTGWMVYARVVRSSVLTLKNQEFIDAARAVGATHGRILIRHILPNIVAPVLVLLTFGFAQFIILESALSFLGLGVPPPAPTWGRMLYEGRDVMTVAPWAITFPGLAIMLTVLAVNFIGDGLRDALDPRLRRLA